MNLFLFTIAFFNSGRAQWGRQERERIIIKNKAGVYSGRVSE